MTGDEAHVTEQFEVSDVLVHDISDVSETVEVTRRKKCARDAHVDVPVKGRTKRLRCAECGVEFPCRHECAHYDCIEARTGEWPAFPDPDPWLPAVLDK